VSSGDANCHDLGRFGGSQQHYLGKKTKAVPLAPPFLRDFACDIADVWCKVVEFQRVVAGFWIKLEVLPWAGYREQCLEKLLAHTEKKLGHRWFSQWQCRTL
jgi:hypothetical protein